MAVTKTIIKNTAKETVVKISGDAGSSTISLASDLLSTNQVLDGATQTVNIVAAAVTGVLASSISIARNSVFIMSFAPENSGLFDLRAVGFADNVQNTRDIVVTLTGTSSCVYLTLRKVSGYKSTVEEPQFGVYDNPNVAGS